MAGHSLDVLLDLDGQVLAVDPAGRHWVRFKVTRVTPTREKPHGLDYSLMLHGPGGERLVGFDNAHQVVNRKRRAEHDHEHRIRSVRPTTRMLRRCLPTSGLPSTGSCATEE